MRPATLTLALALAAPSLAYAAPADVFFVLDTSASMGEPAPDGGGESKLDVARALVARLALAAEARGHRTALLRFRQRSVTVMGGEGPRELVVEAEDQCVRAADVLVPLEGGAATAIGEWVDGEAGQGLVEVEALGDSPLYGAARVALRYIDGLRVLDPLRHCVRALIVVITDGGDTCAGGAELLATIEELEAAAPGEAIQTLVVAFDPTAEAARRIARVGREEADPRVFAPSEAAEIEARVAALRGSVVIESCGTSTGSPTDRDAGFDAGVEREDAGPCAETGGGGGCSVAGPSLGSSSWLIGVLVGLLLAVRHRRRAPLLALLLLGCGGSEPMCLIDGGGFDASTDAGVELLPDPDDAVARLRERQAAVRAAFEAARDELEAVVLPERVFGAITGEPVAGCQALLDTVAHEAYFGAQRGVRGCLATRQCNALDQSLLMQACLAFHGVTTELRACRFRGELDAARPSLEAQEPAYPATAAIDDTLREASTRILDDLPALQDAVTRMADATSAYALTEIVERAREDAAALAPLVSVDPTWSETAAEAELARAWEQHVWLLRGSERIDPVLRTPTECFENPVDLDGQSTTMTVELLVQNVDLSGTSFSYRPAVSLGSAEIRSHERWGERLPITVTGAEASASPDGLPAPAEGNCFRAFIDGAATASFPLIASDASACGGDVPAGLLEGHGFGRLILRTRMSDPSRLATRPVIDRILVDRWGYARSSLDAVANGPVFAAATAQRLIPMRVELVTGGGLLGPHEEYYRTLEDRLARWDELVASPLERLGAAPPMGASSVPAPDFVTATFALARDAFTELLPVDAELRSHTAWRVAIVHRRVHVAGSGIVEKHIFDLLDVPLSVTGGDAAGRLSTSLEVGAVLTEAERLAGMSLSGVFRVLNAGTLLREPTSNFGPYDGDPAHAASLFPLGFQQVARDRARSDWLFVTPGAVDQFGTPIHAWWRVDPLGVAIGEIRYEGTLYGGVTAAKAVATFVRCLGFQAIIALTGPRIAPDVRCCAELVARKTIEDLLLDFVLTATLGGIAFGGAALSGEAAGEAAEAAGAGVGGAEDIADLINLWGDPPECVTFIDE